MWEKVVTKLMSGRFQLTVICGVTFCYAVWKNKVPDTAIVAILMMVFTSYFNKQNGGNGQ